MVKPRSSKSLMWVRILLPLYKNKMFDFFNLIIKQLKDAKYMNRVFLFVFCLFYDFWNLNPSQLDLDRKKIKDDEKKLYFNYGAKNVREYYSDNFFNHDDFLATDIVWAKYLGLKYLVKNDNVNIFRSYFRVLSSKKGFYHNFNSFKNFKNFQIVLTSTFLSGFKFIWLGIRFWVAPLTVFFLVVYTTLVLRALPFNKVMLGWICVLMFVYWLISGFVFFFKKYQFGKYTTAVQRFWRRSYILFWMIEGGTFLVFLFFTFNSSQESFYMFDQISVFKTHLYSWKFFLLKIFPIIILIISSYLLLLSIKWNIFSKHSFLLLVLTFFLTYLVWLEFYQFYHVVNFYGNLNWIYDIDDHSWSLELEPRRTRIVNHYVMLLFMLKFWHIVFIYGFWIFFVLRCWETKRIRYPLLAANFQNFIILYIFAWVFMYPWFKFYFRKFLDIPYYWFYINNRKVFLRIFYNDFKVVYYGFENLFSNFYLNFLGKFYHTPFYYWKTLDFGNNYEAYRKYVIRDRIICNLTNIK